jgi:protein phosphatase
MGWKHTSASDVFVVCDGMGGYRGGGVAAELAVQSLQDELAGQPTNAKDFTEKVRQAFQTANSIVHGKRKADDPDTRNMGSTAVALITSGSRYMVAHVGDSRAYLYRAPLGLRRLTKDHTRAQDLVDQRLLSSKQADTHPDSSLLTRAIGHGPTVNVEMSRWRHLFDGDMLLLCSDGLSGYVPDREIAKVLRSADDPRAATKALIEKALQKGGEDNVTVQLPRYSPQSAGRAIVSALLWCAIGAAGGAFGLLAAQQNAEREAVPAPTGPEQAALKTKVDKLAGDLGTLQTQMKSLQTQLAGLQTAQTSPPPPTPNSAPSLRPSASESAANSLSAKPARTPAATPAEPHAGSPKGQAPHAGASTKDHPKSRPTKPAAAGATPSPAPATDAHPESANNTPQPQDP